MSHIEMRSLPPMELPKPRHLSTASTPLVDCFDCLQHKLHGVTCSTHTATVEVALPLDTVEINCSQLSSLAVVREVRSAVTTCFKSAEAHKALRERHLRYMQRSNKRPLTTVVESLYPDDCKYLNHHIFPSVSFRPFEVRDYMSSSEELELDVPTTAPEASHRRFRPFNRAREQYCDSIRWSPMLFEYNISPYSEQLELILSHQNRINFLEEFAHHIRYDPFPNMHTRTERGMLVYLQPGHLDLFLMLTEIDFVIVDGMGPRDVLSLLALGLPLVTTSTEPIGEGLPTIALGVSVDARVKLKLPHPNGISEAMSVLFGRPGMLPENFFSLHALCG